MNVNFGLMPDIPRGAPPVNAEGKKLRGKARMAARKEIANAVSHLARAPISPIGCAIIISPPNRLKPTGQRHFQ